MLQDYTYHVNRPRRALLQIHSLIPRQGLLNNAQVADSEHRHAIDDYSAQLVPDYLRADQAPTHDYKHANTANVPAFS